MVITTECLDLLLAGGLESLRQPANSMYGDELNRLKEQQVRWREKHDQFMERKNFKREGTGTRPLPSLHPLMDGGGRSGCPSPRASLKDIAVLSPPSPASPSVEPTSQEGRRSKRLSPPSSRLGSKGDDGSAMSDVRSDSPDHGRLLGSPQMVGRRGSRSVQLAPISVAPRATSDLTFHLPTPSRRAARVARHETRLKSRTLSRGPTPELDSSDSDSEAEQGSARLGAAGIPPQASPPSARGKAPSRRMSDFDICAFQARKQKLPIATVKKHYDEFMALDGNKNGILTPAEFEKTVRRLCNVPEDEPTPEHLCQNQWKLQDRNCRGFMEFEEFLLWSLNVAFTQDVTVQDEEERSLRRLAKKHGLNLLDVERMRGIFAKFDADGSGEVDEKEFRSMLCYVMKVKETSDIPAVTVKRYFREVDIDGSGDIDFEEFATWYLTVHSKRNAPRAT